MRDLDNIDFDKLVKTSEDPINPGLFFTFPGSAPKRFENLSDEQRDLLFNEYSQELLALACGMLDGILETFAYRQEVTLDELDPN